MSRPVLPVLVVWLSLAGRFAWAAPAISQFEAVPNGSFQADAAGVVAPWGKLPFVQSPRGTALQLKPNVRLEWDARGTLMWDAEYVLSFDTTTVDAAVPGKPEAKFRAVLWTRLPDQHEPPAGGWVATETWGGSTQRRIEKRFRMPRGVSRFMLFLEVPADMGGSGEISNLSIRPVADRPIPVGEEALGAAGLEQMVWIGTEPGFPWNPGAVGQTTTLAVGGHMGRAMIEPVPRREIRFRRSFEIPAGAKNVQAVYAGDDRASLVFNGVPVGTNMVWQDIVRFPLDQLVVPGKNTAEFQLANEAGLIGLLGRIEWRAADGRLVTIPTNERWECSVDDGATWRPAAVVAVPPPALVTYAWAYPHMPLQRYRLSYELPAKIARARIRCRATNTYRVTIDDQDVADVECAGQLVGVDLGEQLTGRSRITVTFMEVGHQPPAGNGTLDLEIDGQWQTVPLARFVTPEGKPPERLNIAWLGKTWPINVGAIECAATRPLPRPQDTEAWIDRLLTDASPLWQLGRIDRSSREFTGEAQSVTATEGAAAISDGLELTTRPELTVRFDLPEVQKNGVAFVLNVHDADPLVPQLGVYVNSTMCGLLQLIGYDQRPGGRTTDREWVVTIAPERLKVGANALKLRLLPSLYDAAGKAAENQSEEYIRQLALGQRDEKVIKSASWLQWDSLRLVALRHPADRFVNGRPVWMGLNSGTYIEMPRSDWERWILRDLAYLGLTGTDAPLRIGMFMPRDLKFLNKTDPSLPAGTTLGDWQLTAVKNLGIRPYFVFEPGRGARSEQDIPSSHEAQALERYGKYVDAVEIGNEVDHPNYGFDGFSLAAAYATIPKASMVAQELKAMKGLTNLQVVGQGWYHAWDFSVIDAQARCETEGDPGFTDALSAHAYGQSYIIPAVTYRTLYGPTLGDRSIWVTECGAWTPNDENINAFDLNLRGGIAFATHMVQYVPHPYRGPRRNFSLLSEQGPEAAVLEKARSFRRLTLAYGQPGRPLPWTPKEQTAALESVLVNAVDMGRFWKITLVNFSREPQAVAITVQLPRSGTFSAERHGDGATVAAGTRKLTLTAEPSVELAETLAPGEAVEYVIQP